MNALNKKFTIATAFLFGGGYAALVLLGSGVLSVLTGKDDPFSFGLVYMPGWGIVFTLLSALCFAIASARAGLRGAGRVRFIAVAAITATTWLCGLILDVIAGLIFEGHDPLGAALAGVFGFVLSPDAIGLIVFIAAAITGWAYLGTLRWQARNAETKQFAPPEE